MDEKTTPRNDDGCSDDVRDTVERVERLSVMADDGTPMYPSKSATAQDDESSPEDHPAVEAAVRPNPVVATQERTYSKKKKKELRIVDGKEKEVKLHYNKKQENGYIRVNSKTQMCKELGSCKYGSSCWYAHTTDEMKRFKGYLSEINEEVAKDHPEFCRYQQCPVRLRIQLKKTVVCNHFEKKKCYRDSKCTFAHGEAERKPLPKGEMCELHTRKLCALSDEECVYAHSKDDLRNGTLVKEGPEESFEETKHSSPDCATDDYNLRKAMRQDRTHINSCQYQRCPARYRHASWKTQLCRHYDESYCKFGEDCDFAHGQTRPWLEEWYRDGIDWTVPEEECEYAVWKRQLEVNRMMSQSDEEQEERLTEEQRAAAMKQLCAICQRMQKNGHLSNVHRTFGPSISWEDLLPEKN